MEYYQLNFQHSLIVKVFYIINLICFLHKHAFSQSNWEGYGEALSYIEIKGKSINYTTSDGVLYPCKLSKEEKGSEKYCNIYDKDTVEVKYRLIFKFNSAADTLRVKFGKGGKASYFIRSDVYKSSTVYDVKQVVLEVYNPYRLVKRYSLRQDGVFSYEYLEEQKKFASQLSKMKCDTILSFSNNLDLNSFKEHSGRIARMMGHGKDYVFKLLTSSNKEYRLESNEIPERLKWLYHKLLEESQNAR